MKFPFRLFLLAVFVFFLTPVYAQNNKVTAHFAESTFIRNDYVISGTTRSIPPSYIYSIEGYIYRVDLTVILDGKDFVWNKPIDVDMILPDGIKRKAIINQDSLSLYPNEFYHFSFEVSSPKKGWVNIELCAPSELNETGAKFYGTSVCLR